MFGLAHDSYTCSAIYSASGWFFDTFIVICLNSSKLPYAFSSMTANRKVRRTKIHVCICAPSNVGSIAFQYMLELQYNFLDHKGPRLYFLMHLYHWDLLPRPVYTISFSFLIINLQGRMKRNVHILNMIVGTAKLLRVSIR
jgi:hypothetical protein